MAFGIRLLGYRRDRSTRSPSAHRLRSEGEARDAFASWTAWQRGGPWRMTAVLAFTETVSWGILYYAFAVLLLPMQRELEATRGELSVAFSIAIVTRALAAPGVGALVDRSGIRHLMTIGSFAGAACIAAWSAVQSLGQLIVVFVGVGIVTAAVLYEPAFAAVARSFTSVRRGPAILAITIAAGLASTIFLPLTASLVESLGWRTALQVLALILLFGTAFPHMLLLRDPPVVSPDSTKDGRTSGLRPALRDPTFWWLALMLTAGTVPVITVATHLPAMLIERGAEPVVAASFAGSLGVLSVSGRIVLTWAERRADLSTLLAAVFTLQALGLVALATTNGLFGLGVFVLTFGLGFGTLTVAKPLLVARAFSQASFGVIAGGLATIATLAKAASPVVAGVARDTTGSYRELLLGLVLVSVLAAFAAVPLRRHADGHTRPDAVHRGSVRTKAE
jgi:cyanate permease